MKKIYDPLYGLIELNDVENLIIDTPLFQRLRYIKQLGLAHYVYPNANHNRFSHSLGVFYITNKIGSILQQQNKELFNEYYLKNLKIAALLHDIGHFPYSHVSEFNQNNKDFTNIPEFLKWSHEKFGVYLIKNSYLKDILIEKDSDYDIDLICNLIIGNDIADNPILSRIINWELDADRLDYLLRDSHFSGVKYGIVDLNYLINNFEIFDDKLAINEKASRSIENILIARFSLYDRVYTHKTISFFEYILKKVLEDLILDDIYPSFANIKQLDDIIKTEENSERLFELTDNYLFNKMIIRYNDLNKSKLKENHKLLKLKTILFRKKTYQIKNYHFMTNEKKGMIKLADFNVLKIIEPLIEKYEKDIYMDIPINRITKYESAFYPGIGLDEEKIQEIKEQEMKSIWILSKNERPQLFYEWSGTYFKQLFSVKNIKYLIYVNKRNYDLKTEFKLIESKIQDVINTF